jgi:hypothetical protein
MVGSSVAADDDHGDDEMEDVKQDGNGDVTSDTGPTRDGNETVVWVAETLGSEAKRQWKSRRPNKVSTL